MRERTPFVVALAVLLAACGGAQAATPAADPTTPETPPTTAASTEPAVPTTEPVAVPKTAAPPTPTAPPPPTSTNPVVTLTETTDPPTTDPISEEVQARLDVIERTEASWEVVRALFENPHDELLAAQLDDYLVDSQLEGFRNLLWEFRSGNFRSVPRPGRPEVYSVDPASLVINLDAGSATVQVCHIDTAIIVETGGNSDGTDRVALDEIETSVIELDLRLVGGNWKVSRARAPEVEITTCR